MRNKSRKPIKTKTTFQPLYMLIHVSRQTDQGENKKLRPSNPNKNSGINPWNMTPIPLYE